MGTTLNKYRITLNYTTFYSVEVEAEDEDIAVDMAVEDCEWYQTYHNRQLQETEVECLS